MKALPKLLSKSKIMGGYRCLKSIYYTIHRPELKPSTTPAEQALFDQGNEVGEKAREYYPGGALVDCKPWEFVDSLKKTRELLQAGTEFIYEAAFEYKGCYARADILKYNKASGRWTLLEVKSTTKVKPEHIEDVGLQAWIIANSGIKLEKICVVHLSRDCRAPDLSNLFVEVDVTEALREHYPEITPRLNDIFAAIRSPEVPEIDIGPQCSANRRDCEYRSVCWKERQVPEISVFDIPRIGDKAWELYRAGKLELSAVDASELNEGQRRMIAAHLSGSRYVNKEAIRESMQNWEYPLVYLDFETINPAIPVYPGTGPYQQVPFQFSVHVQHEPEGELEHIEFLHDSGDDPRPALIPALLEACGEEGTIVAYYSKFESGCIEDLAEFSEPHREALLALLPRLVDPLPIVRENLYDIGFGGSFSLKSVAPTLVGAEFSYEGLDVADGGAAQRAFIALIRASGTEKEKIRAAMLKYCAQDTLAMVKVVEAIIASAS